MLVHLLLILLFPWRSDGSASAHATVHVLLFLLCWFQDLSQDTTVSVVDRSLGLHGQRESLPMACQGLLARDATNR